MNSADGSNVTRLTEPDSYYSDIDWGRSRSSSPGGGNGGSTTPEQTIDGAISTIESLDSIPQSLTTNLITLLRQVLDSLNNANNTTTANTTTTEIASSLMTQGFLTNATTATPFGCGLPPQINVS
jgi:hypothetical protein